MIEVNFDWSAAGVMGLVWIAGVHGMEGMVGLISIFIRSLLVLLIGLFNWKSNFLFHVILYAGGGVDTSMSYIKIIWNHLAVQEKWIYDGLCLRPSLAGYATQGW